MEWVWIGAFVVGALACDLVYFLVYGKTIILSVLRRPTQVVRADEKIKDVILNSLKDLNESGFNSFIVRGNHQFMTRLARELSCEDAEEVLEQWFTEYGDVLFVEDNLLRDEECKIHSRHE